MPRTLSVVPRVKPSTSRTAAKTASQLSSSAHPLFTDCPKVALVEIAAAAVAPLKNELDEVPDSHPGSQSM